MVRGEMGEGGLLTVAIKELALAVAVDADVWIEADDIAAPGGVVEICSASRYPSIEGVLGKQRHKKDKKINKETREENKESKEPSVGLHTTAPLLYS